MSQQTAYVGSRSIPSTPPHAILAALAFTGVMLAGAWQMTAAARHIDSLDFPFTLLDFREGRTTGGLEKQLDHKLPARSSLIAFANGIRYSLIRGGGDKVRPGLDGWLFSVEEFQFFNDFQAHQKMRLKILSDTARALEAQGITLVIALVPDKVRMHPEKLLGKSYPYWYADRYEVILDTLNSQGVSTVNLISAMTSSSAKTPLYYRTDTHWNQSGAERAAAAVARQIKAVASDLPKTSFATTPTGPVIQRTGDLLRMMGLSNMPDWMRPIPDREAPEVTQKEATGQSAGLFDTVSIPVVLLGTSYSLRGNFHGYLQQALGTEVLNVARDGGGFIQSAKDYLGDESFKTSKPRIVIWEIPERMFSAPLTDTEQQTHLL